MSTLCKNHFLQQLYRKIDGELFLGLTKSSLLNKRPLLNPSLRRCFVVPEREEPGLRGDIPDALHSAALYAALRHAAAGLQRSSLHLRWLARGGNSQGKHWGLQPTAYTRPRD